MDDVKDQVLLSIIVPVYNAEKYIGACVDSLLDQGFKKNELEIICVNDGSTDTSAQILSRYESNPQVKVITKANGGVSSARNVGLDEARGKYLGFVDADDLVAKGAFSKIIQYMEENDLEAALFPNVTFTEDESVIFRSPAEQLSFTLNTGRTAKTSATVWSFIVLTDIIQRNHIRFHEELKYGEDYLFGYYVSLYIQPTKQCFVGETVYYYRQHVMSAMHQRDQKHTQQHMKGMLTIANAYKSMLEHFEEKDWRYQNTRARKDTATMAAMLDAAKLGISPKKFLCDLRDQGLYPIQLQWWTLRIGGGSNKKTWLVNLACFLFPFSWYYIIFSALIKKLSSKRA